MSDKIHKKKSKHISLTPDFRAIHSNHNWLLEKYITVIDKESKEPYQSWVNIGYYGTLSGAIKGAMKDDIKCAKSLQEVISRIDQFEKEIDQRMKGV